MSLVQRPGVSKADLSHFEFEFADLGDDELQLLRQFEHRLSTHLGRDVYVMVYDAEGDRDVPAPGKTEATRTKALFLGNDSPAGNDRA